jgi:hypothetical protein
MTSRAVASAVAAIVAVSAAGGLSGCTGTAARPADDTATTIYIKARSALEEATLYRMPTARAAVRRFVASASGDCRGIMTRAPRNLQFGDFTLTAQLAPVVVTARLSRNEINQFDRVVAGVSWSDSRLTQLVRSVANQERAIANIAPPDLCGAIKAWARDGYGAAPVAITGFLHASRVMAIPNEASEVGQTPRVTSCRHVGPPSRKGPRDNVVCTIVAPRGRDGSEGSKLSVSESTGRAIWRRLRQYESGAEQVIAQKAERLEGRVTAELASLYTMAASRFSHIWTPTRVHTKSSLPAPPTRP